MSRNVERVWRYRTDAIGEKKSGGTQRIIFPSGKASIAAGIPPAALLVGANPEPPLNHRHIQTKVRR